MKCSNHPDVTVSAYCRTCGKALCAECRRDANGSVFCEEHVPVSATPGSRPTMPPPTPPVVPPPPVHMSATAAPPPPGGSPYVHKTGASNFGTSPGLAFLLGFIPGVGAIYNGQYAKGLVHAVIFGLIVSLLNGGHLGATEPLFGILLAIFIFYMAFEAHHTARNRRDGQPVDELSSLVAVPSGANRTPVGPVILIGLGVLLLLDTLNVISFDRVFRYWPVLLIAGGAYMLYVRIEARAAAGSLGDRR